MARLDRLSSVRDVAQIGAVAGREFHYELVDAVAGLPKQRLDEALDQLVRSELMFCRGEIPHAVYTFKHALVRDAAYAGLLKSRRNFPKLRELSPRLLHTTTLRRETTKGPYTTGTKQGNSQRLVLGTTKRSVI
jgi:hypothetical protein